MLIDSIVCSKPGKIDLTGFELDYVEIEWYEVSKKILHKVSRKGAEIGIKLNIDRAVWHGDILHLEGNSALIVEIPECECIALEPKTLAAMGKACYEIGNRHSPLFYQEERLLMPYDPPLLEALKKCGFEAYKCSARLIRPLGGGNGGHSHSHSQRHTHEHSHEHSNEYSNEHLHEYENKRETVSEHEHHTHS